MLLLDYHLVYLVIFHFDLIKILPWYLKQAKEYEPFFYDYKSVLVFL